MLSFCTAINIVRRGRFLLGYLIPSPYSPRCASMIWSGKWANCHESLKLIPELISRHIIFLRDSCECLNFPLTRFFTIFLITTKISLECFRRLDEARRMYRELFSTLGSETYLAMVSTCSPATQTRQSNSRFSRFMSKTLKCGTISNFFKEFLSLFYCLNFKVSFSENGSIKKRLGN